MPKLKSRPPKYQKSEKYVVVYYHGKRIYLGLYGSPESHVAYSRFIAESRVNPTFHLEKGGTDIAISELVAAFLEHTKATADSRSYAGLLFWSSWTNSTETAPLSMISSPVL